MNIEKFQFISVIVPSGKHPAAALSCGMFFIKIGASELMEIPFDGTLGVLPPAEFKRLTINFQGMYCVVK